MELWRYKRKLEMLMLNELKEYFGDLISQYVIANDEITLEVMPNSLLEVCGKLRDEKKFQFKMLIDLCGVDYLQGKFGVVYHLLSLANNQRLRLKVFTNGEPPNVNSVTEIWPAANWYEREAFDMYGIAFNNHPDLRRILTDYDFVGYPLRKGFNHENL
jgi:NADH-quinone oxidoreductase subunit C